MKPIYITALFSILGWFTVIAQEFDIVLSSGETGTKTHQARNSITMGPEYTYTPNGGTLTAEIVNPVVTGTVSYSNFVDPMNRTLNTAYMIGATGGTFNVNSIGAGTYTIPLEVPLGIGGFQPDLSINYNSMSGIGIAGYGWNIGGLSAVTRSPQTYYHDGQSVGVNLTATDRFSLDGQRLICINGTYGSNNSEYRTEIDNFTKVICLTDGTATPKRFLAKTKGGLELHYGYEGDSDQTIEGLTEEVSWYIDKMTDLYGNTIEFEYIKLNGHNYIGEITYGVNTVTFYYKERTDKQTSYFVGAALQQDLILDKIEMKYNSAIVKKYEFKYNLHSSSYGNYAVLNEVIEYGINNSRYNSTAFSYEYPTGNCNNYPYMEYNSYISTNYKQYRGDYNGDGRDDIFTVLNSNRKEWRLYYGTDYGGFTFQTSGTTTFEIDQVIPADLNGDGRQDLMLRCFVDRGYYYPYGVSDLYLFYYAISTENTIQTPQYFTQEYYALSTLAGVKIENSILENSSTDFDGDGLDDMFVRTYNSWKVFGYNYNGSSLTFSQKINGSSGLPGDVLMFGDFNGDGKMDLYTFDANGRKVYTINGNSLNILYSGSYPNKNHLFKMGDFNGDGKTDIFVYGSGSNEWSEWQIHLSTGTGFVANYFPKKKTDLKSDVVYTGDFNGDGRTDILALSKNASNNPCQYYFVTKPNGTDMSSEYYERSEYNKDRAFTLGDFDGNGKTDILVTASSNQYYRGKIEGNTNILLSRVGDGLNNTTAVSYRKLSGQYSNYEKGAANNNFPVFTYMGPLNVVTEYWVNGGLTMSPDYFYKGLKIHRQGKGILGYEQVVMEDSHLGIKTETNSGYDATYFFPIVLTAKSYANNDLVKETKNTWDKQVTKSVTGLDPIFPYISYTLNRNILNGFQDSITFIYDTTIKGSLKEAKQKFDNEVTKTITNTYFDNDETNWYIGRLKEAIVKYEKSNETTISKKTTYTYSTDGKLKPDLVKYLEGTNWYVYKNYDYNTQGNVTQEYAYSNNGGARQTNYTYENDYIRVKTVTNPLSHITTFTYDTYGRKATEKDYLNNTTSYAYDNFGRVTTVTQPDGFVSTTSYNWGLSGGPANACYNLQESGNDGSLAKTWYDRLSRQLRSDVKGFSGATNIYTATEYNSKGQVYRVSEPSFNPAPTFWNVFAYDNYGRQQNITRPSGRNTTYTFDDWVSSKVTETTVGITSWKETNSQGLLTSANDGGGTITYAYYPDGNLKSINAPGGVLTTMEYDIAGNQVKLVDPSAGTIEYTWNAYGQMLTQKNAENKVTEYTYHPDGRVNTKITPEGTETYGYNTNKQLTGITNPGSGVNRGYAYDSKGRVQGITETIAGTNFSTNFTFDNLGRISTRTHPSGIVETNNYNTNGYLASISAGGATRFTVTAMNERQQLTAATYGTNLTGDFGYNSNGYPTHTKARVGTTFRQAYKYEFNPVTGNLNWRQDSLRNLTENFTYDGLDRLLTVTGPQNLTMQYAANGNITGKSDLGTANQFIYGNSSRPYRLTGLETNANLVPQTLQQLTYTSFEQPAVITESPFQATFAYNTEGQRASMVVTQNGSTILTRYYVGSRYIKDGNGNEYTWIDGDAYTAPCVVAKTGGTTNWYYVLRDHLGNITHLVFASTNTVAGEYSFDAWGRRRDRDDWSYTLAGDPDLLVNRGFTGHEWLPWFNLYNMNGRLYDPVVGRFLSPDNYVQMPDFSQNFNRYSYCLNNPLKYNDPSGEVIWGPIIALAIQQAIVGGARANLEGKSIIGGAFKGAAVSIVTSLATVGMGSIAPSFNSTGALMGDKKALLGKYALKAGYATLIGAVAAGSGMLTSDLLDDGRVNISGHDYFSSMKLAGLTAGGISIASSAYKYVTWDRFNLDQRIDILKKDIKIDNLHLGFDKGFGYQNNGEIYLTPLGLENRAISELTIFHEQFHIIDNNRYFDARYFPKTIEPVIRNFEARAHLETLKRASEYNIPSRYWWNSRFYARHYGFAGKIPNTLQLKHIWNNLFY